MYLQPNAAEASKEQYEVYSAFFAPGMTDESTNVPTCDRILVVLEEATPVELEWKYRLMYALGSAVHVASRLKSVDLPMAIQFFAINLGRQKLEPRFSLPCQYQLVPLTYAEQEPIPGTYGLFVVLSPVVFDRSMTTGFFRVYHYGGTCLHAMFIMMQKVNGMWVHTDGAMH